MSLETQAIIQPMGDSAVNVSWPGLAEVMAASNVHTLVARLQAQCRQSEPGENLWGAVVPAFVSVTVHYNPLVVAFSELQFRLTQELEDLKTDGSGVSPLLTIPVCYDPDFAMDIQEIAVRHGLTVDEVVALHCSVEYTVRMIGFSPGFPYLSGLPERLITPRRASPRQRVPAGSVAIGGRQAGIYSLETPGGWNVVGRTPVTLFRPFQIPPSFLNAGDRVRFFAISRSEFDQLLQNPDETLT